MELKPGVPCEIGKFYHREDCYTVNVCIPESGGLNSKTINLTIHQNGELLTMPKGFMGQNWSYGFMECEYSPKFFDDAYGQKLARIVEHNLLKAFEAGYTFETWRSFISRM